MFDDATLRDGEVKLVNYWASWCAPCRAEHPLLEELAQNCLSMASITVTRPTARWIFWMSWATRLRQAGKMPLAAWRWIGAFTACPKPMLLQGDGTIILRFAGPITRDVVANRIRPAMERAAAR
jgi:cytochrome c biogenesis protein CcmG, thiol:disulfide interchange protein DsbE